MPSTGCRPRITALGPTYVKLGQFLATRPDVVGPALARDLESLQDHMPPFPQGEAESAGRGGVRQASSPIVFVSFGPPVAAASIAQVHRAEIETPRRAARRCRQGAAARHRGALQGRSRGVRVRGPQRRSAVGGGAAPAAGRGGRHARPLGRDRDGPAARGGGAVRDGGEHQGRSGFPRAGGGLGPHRPQRADDGMDRRHAAQRPRGAAGAGASISPRSAAP